MHPNNLKLIAEKFDLEHQVACYRVGVNRFLFLEILLKGVEICQLVEGKYHRNLFNFLRQKVISSCEQSLD